MAIRFLLVMLLSIGVFSEAQSKGASGTNGYIVGAAKVEITPPPGFPTGGHGPAGAIARGSWSRLWARAFYIKQQNGLAVVLVSCDLFAIPLGLTAKVWDKIPQQGLKPEGLVIAATHTHQGPGNYLSSAAYNGFASVQGGFSEDLSDFLVDQIVNAIEHAVTNAQRSTLRIYHKNIEPDYKTPFLVNRSPSVFMLNWDAEFVMADLGNPPIDKCHDFYQRGEPEDGWNLEGCPRLRAINRRMVVLEARSLANEKIADLVFFAVHPTVLEHSAPLYNSDFTGYVMDTLEANWGGNVIVGFFNGAEGDITARRFYRDVNEMRDRGDKFQKQVEKTLSSPDFSDSLDAAVMVRARLIDRNDAGDRSCPHGSKTDAKLASKAIPGAAMPGGGELDRTSFYDLGWKEGVRNPVSQNDQGTKKGATEIFPGFDPVLGFVNAIPGFSPVYLPVTYIELGKFSNAGKFSLGALPVEMSTTGGYRIRKDMEKKEIGNVFQLVGLANEYVSYSATASEYAAQDYMGASTLWGPGETEFFACQLANLREQAPPGKFKFPDQDAFKSGTAGRFGPSKVGQARDLPAEDLEDILQDDDKHLPDRNLPFFQWAEQVSNAREYRAARERTIAVLNIDNSVVDGTDVGFIKILKEKPRNDCQTWYAIWIRPLWQKPLPDHYKFQITYKDDHGNPKLIRSVPFSVPVPPFSDKPQPVKVDGDDQNPCYLH